MPCKHSSQKTLLFSCLACFRPSRMQCFEADTLSLNTNCAKSVKCRTHNGKNARLVGNIRSNTCETQRDTAKHPGSSTVNVRHCDCVSHGGLNNSWWALIKTATVRGQWMPEKSRQLDKAKQAVDKTDQTRKGNTNEKGWKLWGTTCPETWWNEGMGKASSEHTSKHGRLQH